MAEVRLDVDTTNPPGGEPAHVRLEVDGFRYFTGGDKLVTSDGRRGMVAHLTVPVVLDDGSFVCLSHDECQHVDE